MKIYTFIALLIIVLLSSGCTVSKEEKLKENKNLKQVPVSQDPLREIPTNDLVCAQDSDCKLIYSNCDCEAALISDPRTHLESSEVCKWNICRGTEVSAICRSGKCVRSDG